MDWMMVYTVAMAVGSTEVKQVKKNITVTLNNDAVAGTDAG